MNLFLPNCIITSIECNMQVVLMCKSLSSRYGSSSQGCTDPSLYIVPAATPHQLEKVKSTLEVYHQSKAEFSHLNKAHLK